MKNKAEEVQGRQLRMTRIRADRIKANKINGNREIMLNKIHNNSSLLPLNVKLTKLTSCQNICRNQNFFKTISESIQNLNSLLDR